MSNLHAHIGITKVAHFGEPPKCIDGITTSFLKPCVALVMFNGAAKLGAVNHLRVRHRSTVQDVFESVRDLKENGFTPDVTRIALIGGNDFEMPEDKGIQTSKRMVSVVKGALSEYGFSIDHEDLYGSHARRLRLDSFGTLSVDDDWKEESSKYPYAIELEKAPELV